jgi:hypothetical protein
LASSAPSLSLQANGSEAIEKNSARNPFHELDKNKIPNVEYKIACADKLTNTEAKLSNNETVKFDVAIVATGLRCVYQSSRRCLSMKWIEGSEKERKKERSKEKERTNERKIK